MESNAFEALRDATRESALVSVKLKELIQSGNRHGDLQVARSAALRIVEHVDRLIGYEQGEPAAPPCLRRSGPRSVSPPAERTAALVKRRGGPPGSKNAVVRARPTAHRPPPAAEELGANGRPPSGTQAALVKLIEKSPGKLTSGDLIHLTNLNAGTVYTALGAMKKAGRIYTQKDDDGDGQSKWHSTQDGA
jgi:hypothetical protein